MSVARDMVVWGGISVAISFLLVGCGAGGGKSGTDVVENPANSGGSATLTWEAPTKRIDGTELTDLAGFKLYSGKSSGNYSDPIEIPIKSAACHNVASNKTDCSYVLQGLSQGTHYFVVTAYTSSGLESPYSNEVSKIIK
jgi:hypothetical protein